VKASWSAVVTFLGIAVAIALWVTHCSGPQPRVVGTPSVRAPAQSGQPYRIEATIDNPGPGHGQAEVVFRLTNVATGVAYETQEQTDLEPGEQVEVVTDVAATEGTYQPEVEVRYPPG